MLWLIWQMWFLLFIAFAIGIAAGWRIWGASGQGDSRSLGSANDEIDRLRRQNDDLTRSLAAAKKNDSTAKVEAVKSTPVPPSATANNDLLVIKGLGPKAAALLHEKGVTSFAQIAAWSAKDISIWDAKLNAKGRIQRDDWVGQAQAFIDED